MDHNRWIEIQQHPPNPNPYNQFHDTHYSYQLPPHQPQTQNPNPNLSHDSYATIYSSHPHPHPHPSHVGGADAQTTMGYAHHYQDNPMGAPVETYYQDSTGVTQSWPGKQVVYQYVAEPVGYNDVDARPLKRMEPMVPANPYPYPVVQQPSSGAKRKFPKKAKIVQSAWCGICQIDCTSSDVLKQHRLGKKHKKNLEKLEEAKRSDHVTAPMANYPIIGFQENTSAGIQQSKNGEDLETKKRKIVEGGAAAQAVKVCQICNVVCNSEVVFHYHLAGQKHAAMVKKHLTSTSAAIT